MSTFSDLLSKAQQLEVEIAKEGTVLVGDAATILKDIVENLQHEVNKEVSAPPASTPSGEPTPNAEGAEAAAANEAPVDEAKTETETPPADTTPPAPDTSGVATTDDLKAE
jgi:hypothetical protein